MNEQRSFSGTRCTSEVVVREILKSMLGFDKSWGCKLWYIVGHICQLPAGLQELGWKSNLPPPPLLIFFHHEPGFEGTGRRCSDGELSKDVLQFNWAQVWKPDMSAGMRVCHSPLAKVGKGITNPQHPLPPPSPCRVLLCSYLWESCVYWSIKPIAIWTNTSEKPTQMKGTKQRIDSNHDTSTTVRGLLHHIMNSLPFYHPSYSPVW